DSARAALSVSLVLRVRNSSGGLEGGIERLGCLTEASDIASLQLIVVDDAAPGMARAVARLSRERSTGSWPSEPLRLLRHPTPRGLARSLRAALAHVTGEVTVFGDWGGEAGLAPLRPMLALLARAGADAVLPSRRVSGVAPPEPLRGRLLRQACNRVTGLALTDVAAPGFRAVRTDLLRSLPLEAHVDRFDLALPVLLARRAARVLEAPAAPCEGTPATQTSEGVWEGLAALAETAYMGDVFARDAHRSHALSRRDGAPRFTAWLADTLRPYLGQRVLEVGAGAGALARALAGRKAYVAVEAHPHCVHTLEALQRELPALSAVAADVTHGDPLPTVPGGFDAVLCVDGLDKADDDAALLGRMRDVLAPDGRIVLLLSHGPWNFGSLDRGTGRQRRYTRATVESLAHAAGMVVRQILPFNRISSIPWW
ncbi:MAG TPA: methyltransferase domain-containing protein, partial [Myxococcota bacterium]|nr:methyltransferase domain-containing protein [Myxococcota bacterium]